MKIHTPLFVIGTLIFITPFLGLPNSIETVVVSAFGIAVMVIVSTIKNNPVKSAESNLKSEILEEKSESILSDEIISENKDEQQAE